MTIPIYQVDAFTAEPFKGNPAGVCLLDKPMPAEWMQNVGREMNLSETAFLLPEVDGYRLRWFTPRVEVKLCGHATLASAHILYELGMLQPEQIARFYTLSGVLTAEKDGDWIVLDFPARPLQKQPPLWAAEVAEALGAEPVYVGMSAEDAVVELADEHTLRALKPDMARLVKIPARAVAVTCRSSNPEFDFVSRFFAPAVGVDEDPVTGSAHTCLTPYWAAKLGRTEFKAFQASERGGVLKVRLAGDRVRMAGQAVTMIKGELV